MRRQKVQEIVRTFPPPVLTGSGSTGQLSQSQPFGPPEVHTGIGAGDSKRKTKALKTQVLLGS